MMPSITATRMPSQIHNCNVSRWHHVKLIRWCSSGTILSSFHQDHSHNRCEWRHSHNSMLDRGRTLTSSPQDLCCLQSPQIILIKVFPQEVHHLNQGKVSSGTWGMNNVTFDVVVYRLIKDCCSCCLDLFVFCLKSCYFEMLNLWSLFKNVLIIIWLITFCKHCTMKNNCLFKPTLLSRNHFFNSSRTSHIFKSLKNHE